MNRSFWLLLVASCMILSCSSNEIGNSKDVNPETIWFDYKVWGEEGDEDIKVMLQYRYGGPNGTTLLLEDPSKVELDGEVIKADSSKMTGAFYEVLKPLSSFKGKHSILFTDINGKQYKEEFRFSPVLLLTEVPAEIQRGDLVFELEGLEPVDYVRVLLTDTSYTSDGINRVDTVKNGKLSIPKEDLKSLVNGPIHLELIKEDEKRVKNGTPEGGVLSISYGLRRAFLLKD